jgi:hypothetical protein
MGQQETTVTATRKNRIMIYGPKKDGTYIAEFKTSKGEALAIRRRTAARAASLAAAQVQAPRREAARRTRARHRCPEVSSRRNGERGCADRQGQSDRCQRRRRPRARGA